LFVRAKELHDGVQPSSNSMAVRNLVRLWTKTGDDGYRVLAEKTLKTFAGSLNSDPSSVTAMAYGLGLFLDASAAPGKAETPSKEPAASGDGAKKSENVVKIRATADKPDANGQQVVTLTITIDEGWHLYANPVPKDFPGIPVTVQVNAKTKPKEVKVEYPKGKPVKDEVAGDHEVYEGTITIKAKVSRQPDDTSPLEVSVKVQACNQAQCLLPGTVKVPVGP
jgi:hypothetical protein